MADTKKKFDSKEKKAAERSERLEIALRANLQRRKKQSRLRQEEAKASAEKE